MRVTPVWKAALTHKRRWRIETASRLEKDFVSWPHACEKCLARRWEIVMELRHLRCFVAVADASSLTVAGEHYAGLSRDGAS